MHLILGGLVLFCFLGTGVYSVSVPHVIPETQKPSTPPVPVSPTQPTPVVPTDVNVNATADDANSTVTILKITDYHYLDWPKIGYQIFMQKLLDALQTLKFFMGLDSMLLKITRTYIFTNDTDTDYDDDNNNSTDVNRHNVSSTPADQLFETNTESPLSIEVSKKNSEITNGNKNKPLSKAGSKENNSEESKHDDVKNTQTESGGFFSTITGVVSSVYHTLTGWF